MAATQGPPPKSPASPVASFFDISDDEEGEYNKIMHSSSGRGVKLLFSKSKVTPQWLMFGTLPQLTAANAGLHPSYALFEG